jgi:hypothetical protein
MAWTIVKETGIKEGEELASPMNIQRFLKSFASYTNVKGRLNNLESRIDANKKSLYPMFAKQLKNGRWVATSDDVYQYYAH